MFKKSDDITLVGAYECGQKYEHNGWDGEFVVEVTIENRSGAQVYFAWLYATGKTVKEEIYNLMGQYCEEQGKEQNISGLEYFLGEVESVIDRRIERYKERYFTKEED